MLCFTLYVRENSKYKPLGAYIWMVDLTEDFLRYELGEAYIWTGSFLEFYGILIPVLFKKGPFTYVTVL